MSPVRALVFDLDNTLFSTRTVPHATVRPLLEALVQANEREGCLDDATLARVLDDCWRYSFDAVAREHDLPPVLQDVMREASCRIRVTSPLEPFPDVGTIAGIPLPRFLVTTGYRRLQESKVEALGIASLFDGIFFDDLSNGSPPGKEALFRCVLQAHHLAPFELLVIGDSAESEIAAGNRLGAPTVQILRPGVIRTDAASFHLSSLCELPGLIEQLSLPGSG